MFVLLRCNSNMLAVHVIILILKRHEAVSLTVSPDLLTVIMYRHICTTQYMCDTAKLQACAHQVTCAPCVKHFCKFMLLCTEWKANAFWKGTNTPFYMKGWRRAEPKKCCPLLVHNIKLRNITKTKNETRWNMITYYHLY